MQWISDLRACFQTKTKQLDIQVQQQLQPLQIVTNIKHNNPTQNLEKQ